MLLSAFKRAAVGRQLGLTDNDDENRWWAVGRHAGLATPLLDWSTSPYVAAFFAYWNEGKEPSARTCSVFRFAWSKLVKATTVLAPNTEPNDFNVHKDNLVLVHPHAHDNPSMAAQSGVFSRLYPPRTDIIAWVTELWSGRDDRLLVRYDLPMSERSAALASLRRMNVHPASLFPDLRGSAELCNLALRVPSCITALDWVIDSERVSFGPPAD